MDYLKNHCWCSSSHWDNKHYDCQIIVSLSSYEEGYEDDWNNLIIEKSFYDEKYANETFEMHKKFFEEHRPMSEQEIAKYKKDVGTRTINALKPEVLKWLEENVKDFAGKPGWCVGSEEYTAGDSSISYSVFFQRRKDAMAFIREHSKWRKPINYCQYFTDVRKRLNLETLKYETR